MMTTLQSTTQARGYVYTADDERMVEFDFAESPWVETWTIRGLDKKVLRQWTNEGGEWIWSKDYIYRGSLLLASEEPEQGQHLHLDHLGTPRLITSAAGGGEVGRHTYFPFGEEVTDAAQDGERMKFTGHERDLAGAGGGNDLDYMHARYYSANIGKFLSTDPAIESSLVTTNLYVYAENNPIRFLDVEGETAITFDAVLFETGKQGGSVLLRSTASAGAGATLGVAIGGFSLGYLVGRGIGNIEVLGLSVDSLVSQGFVSLLVSAGDLALNDLNTLESKGAGLTFRTSRR